VTPSPETTLRYPRAYGKYELLERIGSGGMAEVFRARLPGIAGFEKAVVIKRLHPRFSRSQGFVQMFIDEAKLAAQVQHKNVVQVFELGSLDNGELFIAMEFIDGTDLKNLITAARATRTRLPVWLAVHVAVEILDALAFAHELRDHTGKRRNIVHTDVPPDNIFIARQGDVKLGDFGVARDDTRASDPFPGQMKGKVPYMSPEQLSGLPQDARSDVFSMGIVLWEMLAQRHLFHAGTSHETMARVCGATRPPPSRFNLEVPPALDAVVLAALSVDPGRRLSSAKAMQDALLHLLGAMKGRVDLSDVRNVLTPLLAGPAHRIPPPDDEPLELDLAEDPVEESAITAHHLSPAEAALHLQSPSATGEFPTLRRPSAALAPPPIDMLREPPPLSPPRGAPTPRPPSAPPAPPPRTITGMVRSTGSIRDGFSYTILHPEHAKLAVTTPPELGSAGAVPANMAGVDELFQQFLADQFGGDEQAPQARMTPGSVRRLLAAARELEPRSPEGTPLPHLDASCPFWLRHPDGREVGPMDPQVLLHYLAGRKVSELSQALVSADQVRWLSVARMVRLLSEELIPEDVGMGACTFQGTLKGHSLTAVLGELARTDATGRLVLLRREGSAIDRRELHVRAGDLTATAHNAATFALWEGMLASPFYTQLHLHESMYTAVQVQRPVTDLLASDAAAALAQSRALMARRELREVFTWDSAHFGFDPSAEPLPGRPTPLLRLLPRMVARTKDRAQLRRAVDRYMDTPLSRSSDFEALVAAMDLRAPDLERIEPLGHGYTLGESLAQAAPSADDHYALVLSYVLLELGLLKRARPPSTWGARSGSTR
jgi:serine/threonine protein kinase